MRSEDQLLLLLKGPEYYAHSAAKEMQVAIASGKRTRVSIMHKLADRHFETVMQIFSLEQCCCIIKTWLSVYRLPFNPSRLKTFDVFHAKYNNWILNNLDKIKSY
jgi:hypothetical protein